MKHFRNRCVICGQVFDQGITLQEYKDAFAHPECVEGKRTDKQIPIDHGD